MLKHEASWLKPRLRMVAAASPRTSSMPSPAWTCLANTLLRKLCSGGVVARPKSCFQKNEKNRNSNHERQEGALCRCCSSLSALVYLREREIQAVCSFSFSFSASDIRLATCGLSMGQAQSEPLAKKVLSPRTGGETPTGADKTRDGGEVKSSTLEMAHDGNEDSGDVSFNYNSESSEEDNKFPTSSTLVFDAQYSGDDPVVITDVSMRRIAKDFIGNV